MDRLTFEADLEDGKPPLLLVHGFLSSRRHWDANTGLGAQFRRIRVDLPGHGATPRCARPGDYHPDILCQALERLRVELGIARWFICGQSFGATLTLRHALAHPERVIAQVFSNANGALREAWTPELAGPHAERIARLRREGRAGLRHLPFHPAHARRFPPDMHARLSAEADRCDPAGVLALLEHATAQMSLRARFAETQVPTLLVNGRWERSFQPLRDWAAQALPTLEVVDLEGGHSINVEQPAAFDAAVVAFLRDWLE